VTAVTIRRRVPPDDEQLFDLYRDVFGESLTESSQRRWRWQYLDNPANGPEGPKIWLATESGKILGQYASMPVDLWWGGREVRSSWGMDVFVRREARGRGLGEKLFTYWSDHVDVALGLGLTPSSYGLFRKLHYRDVGPVPFFRKVLDPRAVAQRRLGAAVGAFVAPLLRLGWNWFAPTKAEPGTDVTVEPITGFSAEYDKLWESARESFAMCVRRDAAYLNWKYRDSPGQKYTLWEARRLGKLAGYAISRHEDYRGLELGWLLDVFAPAGQHGVRDALVGAVLESFEGEGVARAQAFALSGVLGESLRRHGFRVGRSPMQFCVRSRVPDEGVFETPDRWHVVFGDSDMDRQ
jgi:GNAT superfamily N-acetyltransferase